MTYDADALIELELERLRLSGDATASAPTAT